MMRILESAGALPERNDETVGLDAVEARMTALLKEGDEGLMAAVDFAVRQAVRHRASDVHVEPWRDALAIRYRIDGILHDVARIPKTHQERIVARIKVLARLVVYQKDRPQDGRMDGHEVRANLSMRVSTFPTVNGEKAVIRVLDSERNLFALDELGFDAGMADDIRNLVFQPQGTVLLTGPSSSGKTTTIYAMLRELMRKKAPRPHILTLEDPVEYRLDELAQTEINPSSGFGFGPALRSLLRQDPDAIMVGEIRDSETAATAVQAGLTGHLIISTVHSGTAAGVFTRLLEMGVDAYLVASSVTGVLAQRLVRVNCPQCAEPYIPDAKYIEGYGAPRDHTGYRKGRGCEACQGIGFWGRTSFGELLTMSDEIGELLGERVRTRVIHDAAVRGGMKTLVQGGVEKVCAGATTFEELETTIPAPKR